MNQFIGILLSGILLTSPITSTSTLPGQYSCTVQVEVDTSETSDNKNENTDNENITNTENNKDSEDINKETSSDNKNDTDKDKNTSNDKEFSSIKEEVKTEIETVIIPEQNDIVPPISIPSTTQESSSSSNGNSSSNHKSSSNSSDKNESLNEAINHLQTEEEMLTNTNILNTNEEILQTPIEIIVDDVTDDTKVEQVHISDTIRLGFRNVIEFGTLTFEKIMYTIRTYIQEEPVISWIVLILLIICITLYIKLILDDKKQKQNDDIKKNEIEKCE